MFISLSFGFIIVSADNDRLAPPRHLSFALCLLDQQLPTFTLSPQPDGASPPLRLTVLRLARIHLDRLRLVADVFDFIDSVRLGNGAARDSGTPTGETSS
jgi:hypothetical protein